MKRIHVYNVQWSDYDATSNILVYSLEPLSEEKIDKLVGQWQKLASAAREKLNKELNKISNAYNDARQRYIAEHIPELLKKTDRQLAKIVGGFRTKVMLDRLDRTKFKANIHSLGTEDEQYEHHRQSVRRDYATSHLGWEFDDGHPYDPSNPARGLDYDITRYRELDKKLEEVLDHHGPLRMLRVTEVSSSQDIYDLDGQGDSLELFVRGRAS